MCRPKLVFAQRDSWLLLEEQLSTRPHVGDREHPVSGTHDHEKAGIPVLVTACSGVG
jgi:hypothetical protein